MNHLKKMKLKQNKLIYLSKCSCGHNKNFFIKPLNEPTATGNLRGFYLQ